MCGSHFYDASFDWYAHHIQNIHGHIRIMVFWQYHKGGVCLAMLSVVSISYLTSLRIKAALFDFQEVNN